MLCPHKQLLRCLSQNHFGTPKARIPFLGLHTFLKVKVVQSGAYLQSRQRGPEETLMCPPIVVYPCV